MTDWKKWKMPSSKSFANRERFEEYLQLTKCGLCHKGFKEREEWALMPLEQSPEEREKFNGSGFNARAVMVHRKCVEK